MVDVIFNHLFFGGRQVIRAYPQGLGELGTLEYTLPEFKGGAVEMRLFLNSQHRGNKMSGILISEFVRTVGSDQRVRGIITHTQTLEYLAAFYPGANSGRTAKLLRGSEELREVPIVRVLSSGGIKTECIGVTFTSDGIKGHIYEARLRGITE